MGSKITIIGAGSVGSTIAHILSLKPYVSELVMIDILKDKADGEIMDMAQGTGFRDPISMISGDYEDAAGSDIVIVTSGVARKPGQTRIELAKTNVAIMNSKACTECTVHHRSKSGRCTDLCILKIFRYEGEPGNWFWYTA